MIYSLLVLFGGIFHVINGLTHLLYPKLYKWDEKLITLPEEDKKKIIVSIKLTNYTILLFWLFSGIIPIIYNKSILSSDIGIAFIIGINIFWLIRIFIIQMIVVGFRKAQSILRTSYFFFCFLLFLIPLVHIVFVL